MGARSATSWSQSHPHNSKLFSWAISYLFQTATFQIVQLFAQKSLWSFIEKGGVSMQPNTNCEGTTAVNVQNFGTHFRMTGICWSEQWVFGIGQEVLCSTRITRRKSSDLTLYLSTVTQVRVLTRGYQKKKIMFHHLSKKEGHLSEFNFFRFQFVLGKVLPRWDNLFSFWGAKGRPFGQGNATSRLCCSILVLRFATVLWWWSLAWDVMVIHDPIISGLCLHGQFWGGHWIWGQAGM